MTNSRQEYNNFRSLFYFVTFLFLAILLYTLYDLSLQVNTLSVEIKSLSQNLHFANQENVRLKLELFQFPIIVILRCLY